MWRFARRHRRGLFCPNPPRCKRSFTVGELHLDEIVNERRRATRDVFNFPQKAKKVTQRFASDMRGLLCGLPKQPNIVCSLALPAGNRPRPPSRRAPMLFEFTNLFLDLARA